jgi:hypothetical protein
VTNDIRAILLVKILYEIFKIKVYKEKIDIFVVRLKVPFLIIWHGIYLIKTSMKSRQTVSLWRFRINLQEFSKKIQFYKYLIG